MKKILIPHLKYTIEYGIAAGEDKSRMERNGWNALARGNGYNRAQILLLRKPRTVDFPTLAHEVMHVLQYIADEKKINMAVELEHFAYLMQFILNEILDYEYR